LYIMGDSDQAESILDQDSVQVWKGMVWFVSLSLGLGKTRQDKGKDKGKTRPDKKIHDKTRTRREEKDREKKNKARQDRTRTRQSNERQG
jgi:hypothetical protein